jgi:hypothetical protein
MRRGGDDRIIRASRAIEHPGRNLKPPSRIGAAQRAAENNIIRLGDRLVDEDRQTKPWMPPIQELAKTGPVGVIKLDCTITNDPIRGGWMSPSIYVRSTVVRCHHRPRGHQYPPQTETAEIPIKRERGTQMVSTGTPQTSTYIE